MTALTTIQALDATGSNEHLLPSGIFVLGYDTQVGSNAGIKWTAEQYAAHTLPYPAGHIDQDPGASDPLADILDIEAGAASDNEIIGWLMQAQQDYKDRKRPGQRWPMLYMSESNVAGAVSILEKNTTLVRPIPFWVANYGISFAEATRRVSLSMGPYPAWGYQYNDTALGGNADNSVFALYWVATTAIPVTPPPPPPATWTDTLVNNLPDLSEGSTGQDVRDMQGLLNSWKLPTTIDGQFGPKTRANVAAFQSGHGITANGVVGEETWTRLLNR